MNSPLASSDLPSFAAATAVRKAATSRATSGCFAVRTIPPLSFSAVWSAANGFCRRSPLRFRTVSIVSTSGPAEEPSAAAPEQSGEAGPAHRVTRAPRYAGRAEAGGDILVHRREESRNPAHLDPFRAARPCRPNGSARSSRGSAVRGIVQQIRDGLQSRRLSASARTR